MNELVRVMDLVDHYGVHDWGNSIAENDALRMCFEIVERWKNVNE